MKKNKYVYSFSEGNSGMRNLLGGKGANLAEMSSLGMSVPKGFIVTTEACGRFYADDEKISADLEKEIFHYIELLEKATGKKFGDAANPLLVSVRSGARVSMPGMMDTILNLGMNDAAAEGIALLTSNSSFAYDIYRRFIQMFSEVAMGIQKSNFDKIVEDIMCSKGVKEDCELDADGFKEISQKFKDLYKEIKKEDFPQEPSKQLMFAIKAVFQSWNNPRAVYYRRVNNIPSSWGTAVTVQEMVFGNMGDDCGTGVAFSRSPSTGENELYGEYLVNAQGEDVVAGIRTPRSIIDMKITMPEIYNQLAEASKKLEMHYKDMQDMEFTIEKGKLYMLQTRGGKRTAEAAVKIACDFVKEGIVNKETALMMVEPAQLDTLLHPHFKAEAFENAQVLGKGLPASPGAAVGIVALSAEEAIKLSKKGEKVIMVRKETSPEDIEGMNSSVGILTARGGMTSHAAVVARGMGKCCVAGCSEININEEDRSFSLGDKTIREGDTISIDGFTGTIYLDRLDTEEAAISNDFETIMKWSDEFRKLKVRVNADTPADAKKGLRFGAQGIGLVRTEHMFFDLERINIMREMILAPNEEARKKSLEQLFPMQRGDFEGIFEAMQGFPVTIRLLDPPLHEFLPHDEHSIQDLANKIGAEYNELKENIAGYIEYNPMMGFRGCRLDVAFPEIAEMQTKAAVEAALNIKEKHPDWDNFLEIMVPLVGDSKEFEFVKKVIKNTADKCIAERKIDLKYSVGTMIELPRACITADKIGEKADFFSFGTNDLTQMSYGLSRDDSGKFFDYYYKNKIFESDPFAKLDTEGVGVLINTAVKLGLSANSTLKLGVCGEHGGEPFSVDFFHRTGLDYVSCSPFRVPSARLAAAQAALKHPQSKS